jgi:hypothetical protein
MPVARGDYWRDPGETAWRRVADDPPPAPPTEVEWLAYHPPSHGSWGNWAFASVAPHAQSSTPSEMGNSGDQVRGGNRDRVQLGSTTVRPIPGSRARCATAGPA